MTANKVLKYHCFIKYNKGLCDISSTNNTT